MLGDGLSPPTCGLAIQNTDSSDSTVAAILNHRPEIHTKQREMARFRGRLPQTPSDENGVRQTPRHGGELRKVTAWPENLVIATPQERHRESAVKVSKASKATRVSPKT